MKDPNTPCPCGKALPHTLPYAACCGRFHSEFAASGRLTAPDAESLMRSRYTAYTLDLLDYLRASWHPDTRPALLQPNEPGLRWLGLQVKKHFQGQDADHAFVEFVARSKLGGRAHRLQEVSSFERVEGVWLYRDGLLS
ncbi:YchJ family protein [Roseateles sp. PN1]|uniref:YchJ family protein n=1 Tax=Roseateles sp. PN1 TaxID=3137372 RepID=UPI003138AE4D